MVNATRRLLYHWEGDPIPILQKAAWVLTGAEKIAPTGIFFFYSTKHRLIFLLFVAIHFLTVTFNRLSVNYHILSHSQHITSGPHNALKDRVSAGR